MDGLYAPSENIAADINPTIKHVITQPNAVFNKIYLLMPNIPSCSPTPTVAPI